MSIYSENWKLWKLWRNSKTDAFNYLLDYLFKCWNINKENEFRGFVPDDLLFRNYHSAVGINDKWQDKEVYSFSLNSYLWFDGRVYNHNFQFYQEEKDLFIANHTRILASNGIYCIYQDLVLLDNVLE